MSISSRINRALSASLGVRITRQSPPAPEPMLTERPTPFSAHGEEAILADLLSRVPVEADHYVDIGAGDGLHMSNTARLALRGWSGVGFELNRSQAAVMAAAYRQHDRIFVCQARITPDNVCDFLAAYRVPPALGVLSLDIDSYDSFVLDAVLAKFRPSVVITEINEKFPPPLRFTVRPGEGVSYGRAHFYGASISQMDAIARRHGYVLACLEYNNLFLVPACRWPDAGRSARDAYDSGYRLRPDRQAKFPWNANMEPLLQMGREDALRFVRARYAGREADYELEWME